MPSAPKRFPVFSTLLAILAAGGATVLAIQLYRRPMETITSLGRAGLLLSGVREETCDVDGFPIHYYCAGRRGSPIVLVHGLGNSAEVWTPLIWLLSREYLVYALDLPGFGKTPLAPEGMTIRTHVLYLQRFLNALGYPRVTLVGNSLGGWIATQFAIENPERVERMYLLDSAGLNHEEINPPYAPDREAAQRSGGHIWHSSMRTPGFLLDALVRQSQMPAYKGFIENYDPQEELAAVLDQVRVPTTIIWGTHDDLLPIRWAHEFHAGIANSELVLLDRVGHIVQIQAPIKVARLILGNSQVKPPLPKLLDKD